MPFDVKSPPTAPDQTPFEDGDVAETTGTLFIKDVTKIDCAVFDPGHGIAGESWHLDLSVTGALDQNGFVQDFSPLKRMVRQVLNSTLDHALIIPVGSQSVMYSELELGESWKLPCRSVLDHLDFPWEYRCPKGATYPLRAVTIKPSFLEQEITKILRHRMPESISSIQVKLREEAVNPTEATYKYTHGIVGHEGLCQRLFHGHRSRIEIYTKDERRADLEHWVARDLFSGSVHIATPEQIKGAALPVLTQFTSVEPITLSYAGSLGAYEAVIPMNRLFLVEKETSIECIAAQLAQVIRKKKSPKSPVKVVCYEGIGKGAIAEA